MKMLIDLTRILDVNVVFAGTGEKAICDELIEYSKNNENVYFLGKYDYRKDIASIYSKLDCVYSVYDADNPNVRIALPNKLYEAIFCELPIIVAKKTYLSELVESMGVGFSVDHKSILELKKAVEKMMNDENCIPAIRKKCNLCKDINNIDTYNVFFERIIS